MIDANQKRALKRLAQMILFVTMMALTVVGALAYTDWQQPITRGKDTVDDTNSWLIMHEPMASGPFDSSCSIPAASYYQLLVDDTFHDIWVITTGQLQIYDQGCNWVDEILLTTTSFGPGFMIDYDNDQLPNMLTPVRAGDGTITIQGFEYSGTTLSNDKNIDLGAGITSCTGLTCDRDLMICSTFCNDGNIYRIDPVAGTYTTVASQIGAYKYTGTSAEDGTWSTGWKDNGPIKNSVSYGDVDKDGHIEVLYYTHAYVDTGGGNVQYYVPLQLYDLTDNVVQSNYTTYLETRVGYVYGGGGTCGAGAYANHWGFSGAPAVISRIDGETSYPKILFAAEGQGAGIGCAAYANIKLFDSNWNILHQIVNSGGVNWRFSNFVVGDLEGDNQYEYCITYGNTTCYESTYTQRSTMYINDSNFTRPMMLTLEDYGSDSELDFISVFGIFTTWGEKLFDFGIDETTVGALTPADISDDNSIDFIYNGRVTGGIFNTGEPPCVEDWHCGDWGTCYPNETQYRTCDDWNMCGTEFLKPPTEQPCICEDWQCTIWSSCYQNNMTRVCTDANQCGTEYYKPIEYQWCDCTEDWFCGDWAACLRNNTQTRICSDLADCGTYYNQPPLWQNCTYRSGGGGGAWPEPEQPTQPVTNTTLSVVPPEETSFLGGITDSLASITGLVSFQGVSEFTSKAGTFVKNNPLMVVGVIAGAGVVLFLARPTKGKRVRRR